MTCEVRNKEINSQCAELLVRPLYIAQRTLNCVHCSVFPVHCIMYIVHCIRCTVYDVRMHGVLCTMYICAALYGTQ